MKTPLLLAGLALAFTGSAYAGTAIISITYSDLSGNYTASSASTGTFSAHAIDLPGILRSAGDVSRLITPNGNADFQPGFVSGADLSDFAMCIAVTHTGTSGTGAGTFTATDADGDTITGSMSGTWGLQGTFLAFQGVLSNVVIHDNGTLDHTFNGSNTGSWDTSNFPTTSPYDGAVVHLTERADSFFATNWTNAATGVTAQVTAAVTVPLPPGGLAGLGTLSGALGLSLARRRR